jgi:hypothetical protein
MNELPEPAHVSTVDKARRRARAVEGGAGAEVDKDAQKQHRRSAEERCNRREVR